MNRTPPGESQPLIDQLFIQPFTHLCMSAVGSSVDGRLSHVYVQALILRVVFNTLIKLILALKRHLY